MSYNPYLNLKAQNSNIANFSSTNEETYILLIANDSNDEIDNKNVNNAVVFGANVINESDDHEAYIGVREGNNNNIVAKFNNQNILFKVEAIFDNNIIPSNNNTNIGSDEKKWGTIYADNIIADGSFINNINLEDKTADELIEGTSNKYYKKEYFDNDLNSYLINREQNNDVITLDNIQQGTINKSIENGFYKGTLTVDNIIVNNYDPDTTTGFHIEYNIDNFIRYIFNIVWSI